MEQFVWVLHAIALIALLKLIVFLFHISFGELLRIVFEEFRSLIHREPSVASFNMAGTITALVLGVTIIAASKIDKAISILQDIVGMQKVEIAKKSINYETLFYVVMGWMMLSIICVLWDRRR